MSTRCNIIVKAKGNKITLYHHWDGYIEGVGQDLVNKLEPIFNSNNKCYWSDVVNMLVKNKEDEGYERTSRIHGDIEYLYTIDTDKKTIKVQTVGYGINYEQKFFRKKDVLKELEKLYKKKESENANVLPQN